MPDSTPSAPAPTGRFAPVRTACKLEADIYEFPLAPEQYRFVAIIPPDASGRYAGSVLGGADSMDAAQAGRVAPLPDNWADKSNLPLAWTPGRAANSMDALLAAVQAHFEERHVVSRAIDGGVQYLAESAEQAVHFADKLGYTLDAARLPEAVACDSREVAPDEWTTARTYPSRWRVVHARDTLVVAGVVDINAEFETGETHQSAGVNLAAFDRGGQLLGQAGYRNDAYHAFGNGGADRAIQAFVTAVASQREAVAHTVLPAGTEADLATLAVEPAAPLRLTAIGKTPAGELVCALADSERGRLQEARDTVNGKLVRVAGTAEPAIAASAKNLDQAIARNQVRVAALDGADMAATLREQASGHRAQTKAKSRDADLDI